ncbi:MAG: adenosylcobinamide-GDP ribazoletransferase [Alphaproteobacteria bacterium]
MVDTQRNVPADIRTAITFLTRLPVGGGDAPLARAAWAFPVAGALVGLIAGLVFLAAGAAGLPGLAAAFLALIASALVTGALHEDGLADAADGLFIAGSAERKLDIMRDSRTGGFGALALVLITGLKAAALAALPMDASGLFALVAVHAVARAGLPGVMALMSPASRTGLAAGAGAPTRQVAVISLVLGVIATGCLVGFGFGIGTALTLLLAGFGATAALALYCRRAIGGHNGDTLGAMEQLAETAALLVLAAAMEG